MKTNNPRLEMLESRLAPSTFTVTAVGDAGGGSLRKALADADNHAGPDTIVFHLPAPPLHSENIITLTSGDLTSKGNVTITGPGAGRLIIDGNNADRIFFINDTVITADSPTIISGLSIIHGNAAGYGGGIFSYESLTLKNVVISGNVSSQSGGGVSVLGNASAGTKVGVSNSLIAGNIATGYGGGLHLSNLKSITISKSVVTGNSAGSNSGGGMYSEINGAGTGIAITGSLIFGNSASYGGGLSLNNNSSLPRAKITVSACTIGDNKSTGNGAIGGGGLFVTHGAAVITGSTISNNTAVYFGGGIQASNMPGLTISKCTISGNRTTNTNATYQGGGGVFVLGTGSATTSPVKITDSRFIGNRSAGDGAGLLAGDGLALTISGTTFSGNRADSFGGGISTFGFLLNKVDLTVSGSTFANNSSGQSGGGIEAYGAGLISISTSKVSGNVASNNGGGIYASSQSSTSGLILKNLIVSGNVALEGGGLSIVHTLSFQINGGSFTANVAGNNGGGIDVGTSTGSILGATISGNVATTDGGGVYNLVSTVTLQIAKVFANTALTNPDVSGTFTFV